MRLPHSSWRRHLRICLPPERRAKIHPGVQRRGRVRRARAGLKHGILPRGRAGEPETRGDSAHEGRARAYVGGGEEGDGRPEPRLQVLHVTGPVGADP